MFLSSLSYSHISAVIFGSFDLSAAMKVWCFFDMSDKTLLICGLSSCRLANKISYTLRKLLEN